MKITINEPANALQQIVVEDIEKEEVPLLESILELFDLQYDFHNVHNYYTNKCNELTIFDRLRKDGNKMAQSND